MFFFQKKVWNLGFKKKSQICKDMILTHPKTGETFESECLGQIFWLLKLTTCNKIGTKYSQFRGNSDISKVTRSASNGRINKFDPPLSASVSGLSSAFWLALILKFYSRELWTQMKRRKIKNLRLVWNLQKTGSLQQFGKIKKCS